MDAIGELNRHERGPMIAGLIYADHRRVPFASGEDFQRGVEEMWALVPDARYRVNAVHALDAHGTVVNLVIEGTDAHGNELQWAQTILFVSDGPRVRLTKRATSAPRSHGSKNYARRGEGWKTQQAERTSA